MNKSTTHYSKTSLVKKSIQPQIQPQKSTFTRWLQRLFCLRDKNEQQLIANMEISNFDIDSQQPTMKIISKLSQYDEYFCIDDPIKIISGNESQLPFVAKFDQQKLTDIEDMYDIALPNLKDQIVLLVTQNVSISIIYKIENMAQSLIIQLQTYNQEIEEHVKSLCGQDQKFNTDLMIGKFAMKKSLQIIDQYLFMPDYTIDGKNQVIESVTQILKIVPHDLDKFTFFLKIQGNPIQDIFTLGYKMNEAFLQRYENQNWIKQIIRKSSNRSGIVIKQKDQKRTGFEKSQYMILGSNFNSPKQYNLNVDNTEFILNLIKYQQGKSITHVFKCLIYQKGYENRQNQQNDLSKIFCYSIFFSKELKTYSQYDPDDYVNLIKIIKQCSFISCCICISLLKQEDLKVIGQLKLHYKRYLEILVVSGIIINEQDSYLIQSIFNKCLNFPMYDIILSKNDHLPSIDNNFSQQIIQNDDQQENNKGAYSLDYNYPQSEQQYDIILGLQQELNYSELQIDPQKRFTQVGTSISNSIIE